MSARNKLTKTQTQRKEKDTRKKRSVLFVNRLSYLLYTRDDLTLTIKGLRRWMEKILCILLELWLGVKDITSEFIFWSGVMSLGTCLTAKVMT